jgi:diguanylate cyclase (GGDEF)-like protein
VRSLHDQLARDKRLMAYTAAAMYGGAALDGAIEGLLPGDPSFALAPVIGAAVVVTALIVVGPSLPRWALATLGPIGVILIGDALAATPGPGDGAILYVWPVLWMTFFFGRRGALAIVVCVGVTHAIVLSSLPSSSGYPGRWLDVMVTTCVLVAVVLTLVGRNQRLVRQLGAEARTDALTSLLNRRGFDERAELELTRARREAGPVALAAFDIDYFKRVNDEWGHEIGDQVLARIGALLAAQARDIDVVARFGGEEFMVLLPGCEALTAKTFAERVRAQLRAGTRAERRAGALAELPDVRLSVGVTSATAPSRVNDLLQSADAALYRAKRGGRDRIEVLHPASRDVLASSPSVAQAGARDLDGEVPSRAEAGQPAWDA